MLGVWPLPGQGSDVVRRGSVREAKASLPAVLNVPEKRKEGSVWLSNDRDTAVWKIGKKPAYIH